ncbi:MAG: TonB-dependent receptor [Cyclobacteriaceae bacterium]
MNVKLPKNVIRMSKLTLYVVIACQSLLMSFASGSMGQRKHLEEIPIELEIGNGEMSLSKLISQIEAHNEFQFAYAKSDVRGKSIILSKSNYNMQELLREVSLQAKFSIRRVNETIALITLNENASPTVTEEINNLQQSVTGTITDENGEALPGATIQEKGTTNGTITDVEGRFNLNVQENSVLTISFVGYETKEVAVNSRSVIDVSLSPDISALQEVVVVGYGETKKVNLTGAVESVSADKVNWKPVGQTSMALQGVAPGVTITQDSGQPGKDGGTIRIRGIGTLGTAGQDPLILVDGVPTTMNNVDPNDIENISVLKDAASAAIYGSRAANGVIIITTKRAKEGGIKVSYSGYVGKQSPTNLPTLVSGLDHMLLLNEANVNMGQTPTFQQSYIDAYRQNAPSDLYPDTDWQDLTLTNNGLLQNHSVDISGGTDAIKIRGSLVHFTQNGLIPNTGYIRNSLRINTDIKASDRLNFKFDVRGSDELQYEPSASVNNIFNLMNGRVPRNQEGLLSDGRYGQGWLGANPISFANSSGKAKNRVNTAIINMQGEWEPIDNLSINFMYAPRLVFDNTEEFTHTINTYYGDGTLAYINPNRSSLINRSDITRTDNVRALVNYSKQFDNHHLSGLLGYEQIENSFRYFQGYRENFPFENYQQLSLGSEVNQQTAGSANEFGLRSYFGRLMYNFQEKYLFEANLRYDGSSRFADDNKYGWFPSFSAGWRISEELFMQQVTAIDNLKLRASWGTLGNQNIGNYPFAASVDLTQGYILNEAAVQGAALTDLANPYVSWETTEMVNVGLDITFLQRFSIAADYYVKNTRDILLQLPIPLTVGLEAPFQNAGVVKNTGFDLSLTHFNAVSSDFEYDITFALSDVKNEIVDLKETGPYIASRTIRQEGQPIDALYGFEAAGLFQTDEEVLNHATQFGGQVAPGDIKYVDQDGDGAITADGDRVVLGSAIPRYTYSLNISAKYKGLDFGMFWQGVGKANGYLDASGVWAYYVGSTATERHLDRWTPENTDASYPRLTFNYPNNEQASSYWMLNAAYLRLKNVQVGYSLPTGIMEKTFLDNLRVYVSGQNVLTISDFLEGFDVESPVGSAGFYPIVKTFTLGLTTKF